MITLYELTKRFGEFLAVDQLSLSVAAGEVYGYKKRAPHDHAACDT